jgi:hypothetical protein
VARLVAGTQVEPDHLFDEWGMAVTLNSFNWLMLSVLQRPRPDEEALLDDDSASWGLELMEGMFSVLKDMRVSPGGEETRIGTPDEAGEEIDIDQLLDYWRNHGHEYLDPEE